MLHSISFSYNFFFRSRGIREEMNVRPVRSEQIKERKQNIPPAMKA